MACKKVAVSVKKEFLTEFILIRKDAKFEGDTNSIMFAVCCPCANITVNTILSNISEV